MIRHEEKRLRETFQRLLLLALAAPAGAQACSASSSGGGAMGGDSGTMSSDDGGQDGTMVTGDAQSTDSGTTPQDSSTPTEGAANCNAGQPYFDDASFAQYPEAGADAPYYSCYYFVDLPCGANLATGSGSAACYVTLTDCAKYCSLDGGFVDCRYWEGEGCSDGGLTAKTGQPATLACGLCNGVGRRPSGLRAACVARTRDPLGEHFAQVAHLEAASVFAFQQLRDELALHGAPQSLLRCAERSIRDEQRHARVMARLARRHGGEPVTARVRRRNLRRLERVARENAVEGCVRETFGALVATWQAEHAEDQTIRARMARVAQDETRHAALAWAVAKWADARLDAAARARVARARRAAARRLADEVTTSLPASASRAAGLPTDAQARALVEAMSGMWA